MERRKALIETLVEQKANHDWQGCLETIFRILYGLPVDIQMNLAQFAINQYLPIFQRKWPAIAWPAKLVSDVNDWLTNHGRNVPSEPDLDAADSIFLFSFDALVLAASNPNDRLILTSSCLVSVNSAINALQCNVWIADDPEGVEMWRQQGYFPGRSMGENRPAIAVAEREWEKIGAWLRNKEVWLQTNAFPIEEIENALTRWNQHEMLLILPRESGALEESSNDDRH